MATTILGKRVLEILNAVVFNEYFGLAGVTVNTEINSNQPKASV